MEDFFAGDALVLDWWRAVVAEVALAELHDDVEHSLELAALKRIAAAAKDVQQALTLEFGIQFGEVCMEIDVAEAELFEGVGAAKVLGSVRSSRPTDRQSCGRWRSCCRSSISSCC